MSGPTAVIVAPTAFKGTISAAAAARAMAAGVRAVTSLSVFEQPLSDGGPGLIDAFANFSDSTLHIVTVTGPSGAPVEARVLVRGSIAFVESADACGWHLVPAARRDPVRLTTRGVAELIFAADELGVQRIVVGLGGSATIDGGTGIKESFAARRTTARIVALADVQTRLLEAARIFGPQKGATAAQIAEFERQFAALLKSTGVADFPGAGAAGGLGYGLHVWAGAEVTAGSRWVLAETGLARRLADARVLITGEGSYDEQSRLGKITGTLIEHAVRLGVPVLLVTGSAAVAEPRARTVTPTSGQLAEDDLTELVRVHLPALLAS